MGRLIRIVRDQVLSFLATWRARRDAKMLLSADDRVLRDLGLSRCDVQLARSLSFTVDPAKVLVKWAAEGRCACAENAQNPTDALCHRRDNPYSALDKWLRYHYW